MTPRRAATAIARDVLPHLAALEIRRAQDAIASGPENRLDRLIAARTGPWAR
jgi:hypothetical protein